MGISSISLRVCLFSLKIILIQNYKGILTTTAGAAATARKIVLYIDVRNQQKKSW